MDSTTVSLIASSHKIIQTFLAEATAIGIRVPRILELTRQRPQEQPLQVESFLHNHPANVGLHPTVVLIASPHEVVAIAEHLKHSNVENQVKPFWMIGSLGLDLKKLSAWREVFHQGIFVEPHLPELKEFKKYFIDALQVRINHMLTRL